MTTIRLILSILALLFAAYIVLMNWLCVIISLRNRRRGIDRHHSTIPIMSFVLAGIAYLIYAQPGKIWMFSISLLDIANWYLLLLPLTLIRDARKKKITQPSARDDSRR